MSKILFTVALVFFLASSLTAPIAIYASPAREPGVHPRSVIIVPDDYSSIQEAVLNAPDGATILVRPGVYREHVVVSGRSDVEIIAPNGSVVVDAGGYSYGLRIFNSTGIVVEGILFMNATNVVEVIGDSDAYFSGVGIEYGDKLLYTEASEVEVSGAAMGEGNYSVYSAGSLVTIEDSWLYADAVLAYDSIGFLSGVVFVGAGLDAYYITSYAPDSLGLGARSFWAPIRVEDTLFAGPGGEAVYMYSVEGAVFYNVTVDSYSVGAVLEYSEEIEFYGTVIVGVDIGVSAMGVDGVYIYASNISASGIGVLANMSSMIEVQATNITGPDTGIRLCGSSDIYVYYTRVVDAGVGVLLRRVSNAYLYHVYVARPAGPGIYGSSSTDIVFWDVFVENASSHGVLLEDSVGVDLYYVFARGAPEAREPLTMGIYLRNVTDMYAFVLYAAGFWNGVHAWRSSGIRIYNLYGLVNAHDGVTLWLSENVSITNIYAIANSAGLDIYGSRNIVVDGKGWVSNINAGVIVRYSYNVTINRTSERGFNITFNRYGLILLESSLVVVRGACIANNTNGVLAWRSSGLWFTFNNIVGNDAAIMAVYSTSIHVYLNNFIANRYELAGFSSTISLRSPVALSYGYGNATYTGYLGNYWDKQSPRVDGDGDGVVDQPYRTPFGEDAYPLYSLVDEYTV